MFQRPCWAFPQALFCLPFLPLPPIAIGKYKGFTWASIINICSFSKKIENPQFFLFCINFFSCPFAIKQKCDNCDSYN